MVWFQNRMRFVGKTAYGLPVKSHAVCRRHRIRFFFSPVSIFSFRQDRKPGRINPTNTVTALHTSATHRTIPPDYKCPVPSRKDKATNPRSEG